MRFRTFLVRALITIFMYQALVAVDANAESIFLNDPYFEQTGDVAGSMVGFYVNYVNYEEIMPVMFMTVPIPLEPETQPSHQMHPRKAIDRWDNVHVVWMESFSPAGGWRIMYAQLDPGDAVVVPPTQISDLPFVNAVYPAIAVDSNGDSHVAWPAQLADMGVWEIYYSKVENNTGNDLTIPDAMLSANDGHHSGRAVRNPLDSGTVTRFIEHPDVAVDEVDDVHVVWSDSRETAAWEVYYQKQDNAASPSVIIDDRLISADDDSVSMCPAVDTGFGSRVHIAWQDARGSAWEVYYQKQRHNGNVVVDDRRVSGPEDGFSSAMPDIAVEHGADPDDRYIHIAFMDRRDVDPGHENEPDIHIDGQWEIYSTILRRNGMTDGYGVPKRQSDLYNSSTVYGVYAGPPDGHSMYPQIACEDDHYQGNTFIKWHDERDGNWEIYETEVHNWCNNPNTDVRVTVNSTPDMYPSIALDQIEEHYDRNPDNKWQRRVGEWWRIYNARKEGDQWIVVRVLEPDQPDREYDMFPVPGFDNAEQGIPYIVGMPLLPGDYMLQFAVRDAAGSETETDWIPGPSVVVAVDDGGPPPVRPRIALEESVPNPFNPRTELRYSLAEPGVARLTVHDLRGRLVAVLADRPHTSGSHSVVWFGRDQSGGETSSGTYLVRLEALGAVTTTKVMLTR